MGVQVVAGELVKLRPAQGKLVAYIVQDRLPSEWIGQRVIRSLPESEVRPLIQAVLLEMKKVFDFNRAHAGELELGLDGQISNWEVASYYKQDAQLWGAYFAARKVDRWLHRLMGKEYPYILPEKIVR